MKMTMTATGDSILQLPLQEDILPGWEELRSFYGLGQARFANLETTVTDGGVYCSSYSGGTWVNAPSRVLEDIRAFGANFIGFANNHTMDFGPDGCLETLAHLKRYDWGVAGAGKDLNEAAAPVYRDCKGGRVAMIAISSSFKDAARAGYPNRYFPGRPGVNPLRHSEEHYIGAEEMEQLRHICEQSGCNAMRDNSRKNGFIKPLPEGVLDVVDTRFRVAENGQYGKVTRCEAMDVQRTAAAIEEAKLYADYVAVLFHSHQVKKSDMREPAGFAEEFCRACIDAGADVIFGGGVHQLRPIELYKNKPIFHSLGNFFFQTDAVVHISPEKEEENGYKLKRSGSKLSDQPQNYRSCIPLVEFEDGALTAITLKPIELGFENDRAHRGLPAPADTQTAMEIFRELSTISAPYGTELVMENGLIKVKL